MTTPLAGRIAVVTGASRGLGRAAALAFARAGAQVVAVARTQGALEELDDAIRAEGGSATLVPLDLRDGDAIDCLGAAIFERWGVLDGLIGNAGQADQAVVRLWGREMPMRSRASITSSADLEPKFLISSRSS